MSSRKRVLVLEDHDDSRRALAALLRRSDFEVSAYDGCEPAERHLTDCDMDIALLDVRMPKELRERCPQTMIVFITGETLMEPLKEAVPDCFVLRKPVDCAVLLELLRCFASGTGYAPPPSEGMDDRARPGNM